MTDHIDRNVEMDAYMTLVDAADRIAAESPHNAAAINRFVLGETIRFTEMDSDSGYQFIGGYMQAMRWLSTGPPRAEADEVINWHKAHRPGGTNEEGTIYVDAGKVPHLVAYLGSALNVVDGDALKAEFVRDYGDRLKATFNPPARTFAWPAMHRWYEGFELAAWHAIGTEWS